MKKCYLFLLATILFACDKDSRILRNLDGETWKVVSYKKSKYMSGILDMESTGENIGTFTFGKDGLCSVAMTATLQNSIQGRLPEVVSLNLSGGKYEVYGSNDKDYDAKMNLDFDSRNFYAYSINKDSKSKMRLTDRTNMQSMFGDGYVIEITIEKE